MATYSIRRNYMGGTPKPSHITQTGLTLEQAHRAISAPPPMTAQPVTGVCDNQNATYAPAGALLLDNAPSGPDLVQEAAFDQCVAFDTFEQE